MKILWAKIHPSIREIFKNCPRWIEDGQIYVDVPTIAIKVEKVMEDGRFIGRVQMDFEKLRQ